MFGIYTNLRISEEESKVLCQHPDDYNWYSVVMSIVFRDKRFFQVREDIKLPQKEDDDGVVLMFEGGNVVYFKTLEGNVTEEKYQSIFDVCSFLEKLFKRPIESYVLCKPGFKVEADEVEGEGEITIYFSSLAADDGEKKIDKLNRKIKNRNPFTISDSIDHMLLPYYSYQNKKVFDEKLKDYKKNFSEYAQKY